MSRVRMPPWPSRDTVREGRRLAGEQPRQQQVGGGRLRVGAARRQAEHGRLAHPAEPQHRARVRRDAAPDEPAADRLERDEERVAGVRRPAARGQHHVDRLGRRARRHRRQRRLRPRPSRRRTYSNRDDRRAQRLDLVPDAPLEARPVGGAERLLDQHADPHRHERRDPDERPPSGAGDRDARGRPIAAGTTCGATFTDATSWPVATTDPSSAVNTSSGSIRSSSSTSRDRTWSTPGCAARRSTRLSLGPRCSSPGPRTAAASRSAASSSCRSPASDDEHGHRLGADLGGRRRSERVEVGGVEAPALRPALAADAQVAREDGAASGPPPDGGPGTSRSSRTPRSAPFRRRSAQSGQRRLDRASRVHHRHRRAVLGRRRGCRS